MADLANLFALPIGQAAEPDARLVRTVAEAINDADLVATARQIADAMVEMINSAGVQHFLQYAVEISIATGEPPIDILQRALFNTRSEVENAQRELGVSERRLAQFRQSMQ